MIDTDQLWRFVGYNITAFILFGAQSYILLRLWGVVK
jgi:hypothetical protein